MRARETCLQRRHRGARGTWVCDEHVGVVFGVVRCGLSLAYSEEIRLCALCVTSSGALAMCVGCAEYFVHE